MNTKVIAVILVLAMLVSQGCASYMVYQHNKSAYKAEDVPVTRVIGDNLGSQSAALGVDALTLWGAYEGIRAINGDNDDANDTPDNDKKANQNSSGENVTIVQGNGNTVNVSSGDTLPAFEATPIE